MDDGVEEGPGLVRRPFWATLEQLEKLDHKVAAERRRVAEVARQAGAENVQVSRSTLIRDWIDRGCP